MKKYLLGICALVLAIGFSSFVIKIKTESLQQDKWYQYDGDGDQKDILNYTPATIAPDPDDDCPGSVELCSFKVIDANGDNSISNQEFLNSFEDLDVINDELNVLNDDSESGTTLQKRTSF